MAWHDIGVGFGWPGMDEALAEADAPGRGGLERRPDSPEQAPHRLVVGDNLEVLRLLRDAGETPRLILIDPPYNTGRDFTYRDRFGADASNSSSRAAWLGFLAPRLRLAVDLLPANGFLAVFIDDDEVAPLRMLLDALLGPEQHLATLVFDRNRKNDARFFSVGHEYLLVYARDVSRLRADGVVLRAPKPGVDEIRALFARLRREHSDDWSVIQKALRAFYRTLAPSDPRRPLARFNRVDARGPHRVDGDLSWPGGGGPRYPILHPVTGRPVRIPSRGWVYPTPERFWEAHAAGHVHFGPDETTVPSRRRDLFDADEQVLTSVHYSYAQNAARALDALFDGKRVFDNPKPVPDLARLVHYLCDENDVVLDFFAGSCSTGHAVWEANRLHGTRRRFVLVQSPEPVNPKARTRSARNARALGLHTIDAIGLARLHRAAASLRAEGVQDDLRVSVWDYAPPP